MTTSLFPHQCKRTTLVREGGQAGWWYRTEWFDVGDSLYPLMHALGFREIEMLFNSLFIIIAWEITLTRLALAEQ